MQKNRVSVLRCRRSHAFLRLRAGNVREEKLLQFTLIFARHKKNVHEREKDETIRGTVWFSRVENVTIVLTDVFRRNKVRRIF